MPQLWFPLPGALSSSAGKGTHLTSVLEVTQVSRNTKGLKGAGRGDRTGSVLEYELGFQETAVEARGGVGAWLSMDFLGEHWRPKKKGCNRSSRKG